MIPSVRQYSGGRAIFGTSSFSSKDWIGPFYPSGMKPQDFIAYYATVFPSVEIDATYYRVPRENMIQGFIDKTPESFIISAKFPGEIVHAGKSYTPDISKLLIPEYTYKTRDIFLERMAKLGPRLGPLLLQFPYFPKRLFSNEEPFLERLDQFLSNLPQMPFRYAVEIRNKAWLTTRFLDMLRS